MNNKPINQPFNGQSWRNKGFDPNLTNKIPISRREFEERRISGTLTLNNANASNVSITDTGGYYTGTEVETALQEIGAGTTLDAKYVNVAGDTMTGALVISSNLTVTGTTTFNTVAYTWPAADGTNAYVLTTNGTGTLSWAAAAASGANTALSNLASVAINTSLISDTDSTDNLGSTTVAWANLYVDTICSITGNALNITPIAGSNLNVNLSTTGDFAVNTSQLYVDTSTGNVGIGTTGPGAQLHLHTSSGSDPAIIMTDGDVAHGMTDYYLTDQIMQFGVISATKGGARFQGMSDSGDTAGVMLAGVIGVTDPTDTTPAIDIFGSKKSGTDRGALGDSETVLGIRNWATNLVTILGSGNVGIGTTSPLAKLHIDQATADAALPVLSLDQADISDGFINFIGTSAASAAGPISTWTTGNAIEGFVRVEINGVQKWMPYYTDPTG